MRRLCAFVSGNTIDIFSETTKGYLLSFDVDSFLCAKLVKDGIELISKNGVVVLFECTENEGEGLIAQIGSAVFRWKQDR